MRSMSHKIPGFSCFQNLCVPKKGFSFWSLLFLPQGSDGKIGSEINTTAVLLSFRE